MVRTGGFKPGIAPGLTRLGRVTAARIAIQGIAMSSWSGWDWIAYGCLGIAALGLGIGTWGKDNPEMLSNLPSLFSSPKWSAVPAILFVLATLIFIARLFVAAPNAPMSVTAGEGAKPTSMKQADPTRYREIIKHLRVEGVWHPDNPLPLSGEAAEHISRVRVVVEVKARAYGRWIERFRVELPPITDKLQGDRIFIPLVSYVEKPNPQNPQNFLWGDSKENYPVFFGPMLVRILLTNAKGEDQAPFYFMLFRGADVVAISGDATTPKSISLLQGNELDWMKQWDER